MYSLRRHPNHSYYHSQYWTMDCRQQQQQEFLFRNRQIFKTRQQCYSSTKFLNQKNESSHRHALHKNTCKSSHSSTNSQDISLPVYRAPCTFQNSLITTDKDGSSSGNYRRSPLSSSSSSCVPDVYSPGPTSSGNCSLPPPSSNLPPPPSEWLD